MAAPGEDALPAMPKTGHSRLGAQHEAIFNIAMEIAHSWPKQRDIEQLEALTKKLNSVLEAHFDYEVQQLADMDFQELEARKAEHRVMLGELQSVRIRLAKMESGSDVMAPAFMVHNFVLATAGYLSHGGIYLRAYSGGKCRVGGVE